VTTTAVPVRSRASTSCMEVPLPELVGKRLPWRCHVYHDAVYQG
jgi:hypothetical protein